MKIDDYTREEKQQALDEAWEMMNPKHVRIVKEKKGRATVIEYNSNMYVLRHKDQMNRR